MLDLSVLTTPDSRLDKFYLEYGEAFGYDTPPDYWLVEMSGIPFGLMGEMFEGGGNPWRGAVFGMTNRLGWQGDPQPIWKLRDDFGMAGTELLAG